MFKALEVVKLTHDIKKYNLNEGEKGTILEIYNDGEAYEVEFITPKGKTIALLTLMRDDITSNKEDYKPHIVTFYDIDEPRISTENSRSGTVIFPLSTT